MKYIDEFRNKERIGKIAELIQQTATKQHAIMEVCGGQTHGIIKHGIDQIISKCVRLIHGPGCPVCVTPIAIIDKAIQIASQANVIFCSFGDMLRVPGSKDSLLAVRARGADVRIVYSPTDAVDIAIKNADKEVVFFAVGFETTAPANAMAVNMAHAKKINNFSLLTSQVLVPPALEVILSSKDNQVSGFLAAGHVCTVMGINEYIPICEKYKVPIVVTGFEPIDLLQGIYMCVKQLEEDRAELENQYARVVHKGGNVQAQKLIKEFFEVVPREWRGIGCIPNSGLDLCDKYKQFNAELRFGSVVNVLEDNSECIAGLVLQGTKKPSECEAFGKHCSPDNPLGALMVSNEGACAAYYRYRNEQ